MRESDLAIQLVSILAAGMTARQLPCIARRDNQPRQAGTPSGAFLSFHHVSTVNVGWPGVKETYNPTSGLFDHTETQRRESRYQIGGLAPQSPAAPTAPTTGDYVNLAASIMQARSTIQTLAAQGIGIQHITSIESTYFVDDKGQFEQNPTFDIVFSHEDIFTVSSPKIDKISSTITRVLPDEPVNGDKLNFNFILDQSMLG